MGSCVSLNFKKDRKKNKSKTNEMMVTNVAASPEISEEITVPTIPEVFEETMMTIMAVFPEISEDLLICILARLPAKSLMRFKCVSKLWLSLITSRFLSNLFLKTSPRSRFTAYLANHVTESEYLLLTSSSDDSNTSFSVPLEQDLPMPTLGGGYFVSYVRGLVCFRNVGRVQVCNFTTRQVIELPTIKGNYRESSVWCCFGHDPVNDEYKVVSTVWEVSMNKVTSEHHVLTLGPRASWRKTRNHIPHRPLTHYYKGLIINGVLYYRGWTDELKSVVMSFNFSSEEFNMLEMPTTVQMDSNLVCVDLMIYEGKLAVFQSCIIMIDIEVNVWVLEENAEKKSHQWSDKTNFVMPFSLSIFFCGDMVKVGGTGRSGQLWFTNKDISWTQPSLFFCYDLEKNEITRVISTRPLLNNFRLSSMMIATIWDHNVESVMYLET